MRTLLEFIDALEAADLKDDLLFHALMNDGKVLLSLSDGDVAHQFGASRPTVDRWLSGKNAPHWKSRRVMYEWLLTLAEEKNAKD